MSERDTHFIGSAKALLKQLYRSGGKWIDTPDIHADEQWEQLFAQYAYDLVGHALDHAFTHNIRFGTREEATDQIPDMIVDDWHTLFLASQRPDFVSLRRWIQEVLKRDIGTITNLRIECEVVQIAPKDGWKQYERGQRMFFEVEFQDGVHEMYHGYTDGRPCLEDANWRYPS